MLPGGLQSLQVRHRIAVLRKVPDVHTCTHVFKVSICSAQVKSGAASGGNGVKAQLHVQLVCQRQILAAVALAIAGTHPEQLTLQQPCIKQAQVPGGETLEEVSLAAPGHERCAGQVCSSPCDAQTRTPGACLPPHRRTPACSCRVVAPDELARLEIVRRQTVIRGDVMQNCTLQHETRLCRLHLAVHAESNFDRRIERDDKLCHRHHLALLARQLTIIASTSDTCAVVAARVCTRRWTALQACTHGQIAARPTPAWRSPPDAAAFR